MDTHSEPCVIGIDYGTDSVRAILVGAVTGRQIGTSIFAYPRWSEGLYCDPSSNQFRQHPLDYIEGLRSIVGELTTRFPAAAANVKAIAVDTTASTPCLVDRECRPLALSSRHAENPSAMFVLWKDHTGEREAAEINRLCEDGPFDDYRLYSGGYYSVESFWVKVLHVLREDPSLRGKAYAAIELCDFIPAILTGASDPRTLPKGHCAAASKAMWGEKWGGYPPAEFFGALDEDLQRIAGNLNPYNYGCDTSAGVITREWAEFFGLPADVKIGVGNVDAHTGAVGAGIMDRTVVLNLGTSSCYMAVVPPEELGKRVIEGTFGQVNGSIVPGMVGFELGMSAFGDVYAWFRKLLMWPLEAVLPRTGLIDPAAQSALAEEIDDLILPELSREAALLPRRIDAPFATDWFNGRRSPSPNPGLTAGIMGLTLSATAPEVFYALVEATAFATKTILDHLVDNGVAVEDIIAAGGISQKSPFAMQMLSDVLGRGIGVTPCTQTCAMGSVVFASVVAGVYEDVVKAQQSLCPGAQTRYLPDMERHERFMLRYAKYVAAGKFTEKLTQKEIK